MWKQILNIWKSDNLLEQAWSECFEMLEITYEMFCEAKSVLRESEQTIIKKEIKHKDIKVNKFQRDVRRKVMTHCTVQGSSDLPGGLILINIVVDIERIGDYTKNIVDLATIYPTRLEGGLFEDSLKKIEDSVKDNFFRTKKSLKESNEEEARKLLKEYKWINPECDQRSFEIIQEKDKSVGGGKAATLALYFRWLKRINSHLRNITTSIVNPFDKIGYTQKGFSEVDN